ncbi:MAG: hypothetical protein DF168_00409 [Candidatus Moanabacter tarae]|uniref:Uncharacterized protein n=1 Tax=Candidatus Moanibacter tarae TaxID=2200854 RepID=A0A2Z4AE51_9BACT|nr:MAG: hypothetical protein DF168_00409 [Candidatus Moanabacter tarae]|tara:strand:- start:27804 stop:30302 length:2499 start_codon:yes stop_codon:yes gene_type:complete
MNDYYPLDLDPLYNAGVNFLSSEIPLGQQLFRGLPFKLGDDPNRCIIAFGKEKGEKRVELPIEAKATWLIIAQRLLESKIPDNGPVGEPIAKFRFHFKTGEVEETQTRDRFEISTIPSSISIPGSSPFIAVSDTADKLLPRWAGDWSEAGRRQTEVAGGRSLHFVLWAWENPHPEQTLEKLEIVPIGPAFIIGGITVSSIDENPFCREATREVIINLPRKEDANRPFNLEVQVDRGINTYPYPLPSDSTESFLKGRKGWGEKQNPGSSPSYAEIAANPSATISVKQNDEILGEANWGDLREKREIKASERLELQVIERGKNWVHTTVVDDNTGQPIPCRIHFRSPEGIPYAPHGHHAHVNTNLGTWHSDVGGDVRMGQITYAYVDGTCQGWLPCGNVTVDVARGFEYEPLRTQVEIKPGQRNLELRLKRWCNMNKEGWYSGDSHVHFLSAQGSLTEAQGEDLNVVNLLQSQWGGLFTNTEEFTGGEMATKDGSHIVYVSQENRQHFLGHLILMGLKEPVMPWCSDGPGEAEMGGTLEVTMSDWADQCHAQGGNVVIPHLPSPNGEPATLIATGRADAVEMLRHGKYTHGEYYRYLNCGYKLPLVGGTDKMSSDVPVGIYRTYVQIPKDQPFTYDNWCRAMTSGRTFHSGGPLIRLTVEGCEIGDTINLPGNGGTIEVEAKAESVVPIHTLEIVQEGRVVASVEESEGTRKLHLRDKIEVKSHSWIAARCSGPGYFESVPHYDGWGRGIMAHTSPVYIACGEEWWMFDQDTAQYMLTLVEGTLHYMRQNSRQHLENNVTHHHGEEDHSAYLERPFLEARKAIHDRMHQLGIPH